MIQSSVEIGMILSALLFYANFDSSFEAVYSRGDGKAVIEVDKYEPVITRNSGGRFGEAAEFVYEDKLESIWTKDVIRYPAKGNFPYTRGKAFDGTIGMWLQVDMELLKKRSLVWLDPVHLLSSNDSDNGKIWMDFVTRELPDTPIFRFGATLHRKALENKDNPGENHVIIIPHIDFKGDRWHHVVGTWKSLNGTGGTGVLHLYFDGTLVGAIEGFDHPLDWNIDEWEIRVGLGFKGNIDDFFILNRFLTPEEVAAIYQTGVPLGQFLGLYEK